jgi:hypothetical protein
MTEDEMSLDKMTVYEMSVVKMRADEMSVDKMTWCRIRQLGTSYAIILSKVFSLYNLKLSYQV